MGIQNCIKQLDKKGSHSEHNQKEVGSQHSRMRRQYNCSVGQSPADQGRKQRIAHLNFCPGTIVTASLRELQGTKKKKGKGKK
jgi:hypothetical protein